MKTEIECLVLEDEPEMREAIARHLRLHGFVVDPAASVHEALAKCKSKSYGAIVTDVQIPGDGGISFVLKLKLIYKILPPVFVVTGHEDLAQDAAKAVGVRQVFRKPIRLDLLAEAIRQAVEVA